MESFKQVVNFPADAAATTLRHSPYASGYDQVRNPLLVAAARLKNGAAGFAAEGSLGVSATLGTGADEHRYTWKAEANDFELAWIYNRGGGGSLDVGLSVIGPDMAR
ncbi:MAG: hypothetical protein U0894_07395 [Pirellulales bacterium]